MAASRKALRQSASGARVAGPISVQDFPLARPVRGAVRVRAPVGAANADPLLQRLAADRPSAGRGGAARAATSPKARRELREAKLLGRGRAGPVGASRGGGLNNKVGRRAGRGANF